MKRIHISRVFPTVILLICAIAFSGCGRKSDPPIASQVQSAPTTAAAEEETNIITVSSHTDCLYNISDSYVLASVSEHIALIRIDSIDGTSNLNKQTGEYVSNPYLYGKATVLKELKGTSAPKASTLSGRAALFRITNGSKATATPRSCKP